MTPSPIIACIAFQSSRAENTEVFVRSHKDFAVLLYLVERPNRLMPKEELLKAVWPDTTVSEGVLLDDLKRFLEHVTREEVT